MRFSLASIIQGEAGTPAGQFAVASTIQNRVNSGLSFGGVIGGSPLDQANAPGQFIGHLPGGGVPPTTISSSAQTFADALNNGTLGNYGDTGNALYFQSDQGQPSTVVGGASANIGGNYFSDQYGQPSSNFVPPSYGGSLDVTAYDPNSSMFDSQSMLGAGVPATSFGQGTSNPALASNGDPLFDGSIWPNSGTGSPAGGDGSNIAANGNDVGTALVPLPTMGVTGNASDAGVGDGGVTSGAPGLSNVPGASALKDSVSGTVNVTGDFLKTGSKAISKAANAVTGGLSGAATTIGQTITSTVDSLEKNATSWLTRGAVFVLAIVLLFGAIIIIAMSNRQSPVVLPVPV